MYNDNIRSSQEAAQPNQSTLSMTLSRVESMGNRLINMLNEISSKLTSVRDIRSSLSANETKRESKEPTDYHSMINSKLDIIQSACEMVERINLHLSEII